MFDSVAKEKFHFIRLNASFKSDLAWWILFYENWNGVSFLHLTHSVILSISFTTDASGWGCGAVWEDQWIQGQWPEQWSEVNIIITELVPIILSAAFWGSSWSSQHVK